MPHLWQISFSYSFVTCKRSKTEAVCQQCGSINPDTIVNCSILITVHQQNVTSATDHIPIGGFIDCPDDISTALSEHIVLLIILLLWMVCVCVCVCVAEAIDNYIFPSNVQPRKAGTGLTNMGKVLTCVIIASLPPICLPTEGFSFPVYLQIMKP